MLAMAEITGSGGISMPRICQRQTARSNVEVSKSIGEEQCLFLLDHLLQDLKNRFGQMKMQLED